METITENRGALRYFGEKLGAVESGGYVRFAREHEIDNPSRPNTGFTFIVRNVYCVYSVDGKPSGHLTEAEWRMLVDDGILEEFTQADGVCASRLTDRGRALLYSNLREILKEL